MGGCFALLPPRTGRSLVLCPPPAPSGLGIPVSIWGYGGGAEARCPRSPAWAAARHPAEPAFAVCAPGTVTPMLRGGRPSAPKPPLPRGVQPGGTPAPRRLARGRAVVSRCGSPHRAPGLRGAMREACCGRRCLIGRAHDPETPGRCCAGQGPGCPYAQLHAPRSSWAAGSRCTPIIARLGGCGEDLPWPDSAACRPGTAGQRSPGEGNRPPTSAPSRARARKAAWRRADSATRNQVPYPRHCPVAVDRFTLSHAPTSRKYSDGTCPEAGERRVGGFQPPAHGSETVPGGSSCCPETRAARSTPDTAGGTSGS